jgi:hypothetical protein
MIPDWSFLAPIEAYEAAAESLFERLRSGDDAARWQCKWLHPRFKGRPFSAVDPAELSLEDARIVVARVFALADWDALTVHRLAVSRPGADERFERAVDAVVDGDVSTLRALLDEDASLATARSSRMHRATLLHYVAANGVEQVRQRTPASAVEIARLLLEAGAEADALAQMYDAECTTLAMLVSSAHPHEAGVQVPLVDVLLDYHASVGGVGTAWDSAVMTALIFGYRDVADALVRRGAPVDTLAVAAGLGHFDSVVRLYNRASLDERHRALALAAQTGETRVVEWLLDAGESPDRFNPTDMHAHSTPMHQAVWGGHLETVQLLVERGARLDMRDVIHDGTPLDWALYGDQSAIAAFLITAKHG